MGMSGINPASTVALMMKMNEVFRDEGTFLSFPLSAIILDVRDLAGLTDPSTGREFHTLAELSLLLNTIPTGPLWQPTGNTYLWDVYGEILTTAQLASSVWTDADQASYRKAVDLLYEKADGSLAASPTVVAYEQFKDAWSALDKEYRNRKASVDNTADAAVRARWREEDEPRLAAEMTELEQRWLVEGHRFEVEEARRTLNGLARRLPQAMFAELRRAFDPATPEIYFQHDARFGRFVPTYLRPSDFPMGAWWSIDLNQHELIRYLDQATNDLRERLDPGSPVNDWLRLEYCSVGVERPWDISQVFHWRSWRFPDPDRLLCDGPAGHGSCPAYIVGLVLMRNIEAAPSLYGAAPPGPVTPRHATDGHDGPGGSRLPALQPAIGAGGTSAAATLAKRRRDFTRLAGRPTVTATTVPGEMQVLAFICQRLPRCPDPDPGLRW